MKQPLRFIAQGEIGKVCDELKSHLFSVHFSY